MMSPGSREATEMVMHSCGGPAGMVGGGEGRCKQEDEEDTALGRMSLADSGPASPRGPLITDDLLVISNPWKTSSTSRNTPFRMLPASDR